MKQLVPNRLLSLFFVACGPLVGTGLYAQQATTPSSVAIASVATPITSAEGATPLFSTSSDPTAISADPTAASDASSQLAPPADVDAPQPQTSQPQPDNYTGKQTSRILGILPNFRAVSADVKLPPQTVKQKFVTASQDSFDYSALFVPLAIAGYDLASNPDPEFGTGGVAYGRYLWHAVVDQTSENFFVEAIVPSVTHEDNRYYTLGHGGFFKRTGYALSRAVITRSDSGKETFNISEVVGAGASAGLSSVYYPTRERSLGNTGDQWGLNVGIDAVSFVVKEFWPDINHALFHGAPPSQTTAH